MKTCSFGYLITYVLLVLVKKSIMFRESNPAKPELFLVRFIGNGIIDNICYYL